MIRALAPLPYFAACAAIWWVSSMERPPVPDALTFRFSDKLLHALAYATVGVAALLAVRGRPGPVTRAVALAAIALAAGYGVVDEVHQSFVPGRTASVGDVLADLVGATLGVVVVGRLFNRARRA